MTPEQLARKNDLQRQRRAADPDRVRAYRRKAYLADPEKAKARTMRYRAANRESYDKYMRRYRAEHAEALSGQARAYRAAHPDKVKEWAEERTASGRTAAAVSKWLRANPDYSRDASRVRRARRRDAFIQPVKRLEIFERDSWTCQLCGELVDRDAIWPDPLFPSIDHIIPLARGGTEEPGNVQTTHLRCNLRKSYQRGI